ncbi:MAG TPA: hypothetical protein VGQ52_13800 [Gemmatimonadaceae bacterium]|jgi:uncharacterized protein (DUF433 family)|nr:hypothetical protein [Gemmatimonadaceae bacterium]
MSEKPSNGRPIDPSAILAQFVCGMSFAEILREYGLPADELLAAIENDVRALIVGGLFDDPNH